MVSTSNYFLLIICLNYNNMINNFENRSRTSKVTVITVIQNDCSNIFERVAIAI